MRHPPVVIVTPHFAAIDTRESTTQAQREARVAELKAVAEKKTLSKVLGKKPSEAGGTHGKLKVRMNQRPNFLNKGSKPVATPPALWNEA